MSKKIVTFGEIMLRLAPAGYYRFVQVDEYGATFGGGEANVAVSLADRPRSIPSANTVWTPPTSSGAATG